MLFSDTMDIVSILPFYEHAIVPPRRNDLEDSAVRQASLDLTATWNRKKYPSLIVAKLAKMAIPM